MLWTASRGQALTALASLGVTTPIEYGGFQVSRNSFFQVNRFLIDRLVECALGDARRRMGRRSLCRRRAVLGETGGAIRQSDGRGIGQQRLPRFGA